MHIYINHMLTYIFIKLQSVKVPLKTRITILHAYTWNG